MGIGYMGLSLSQQRRFILALADKNTKATAIIRVVIKPEDLKKFHAQQLVDWFEWKNTPFTPDCFVKGFKYELMKQFMEEIIIKAEEKPEGVMYSADLLFKNI